MALIKKVEVMKLRYDKCMASAVFKEPLRKVNDNYLVLDNLLKRLEVAIKKNKNKKKIGI